jgi:hypothetical protein
MCWTFPGLGGGTTSEGNPHRAGPALRWFFDCSAAEWSRVGTRALGPMGGSLQDGTGAVLPSATT